MKHSVIVLKGKDAYQTTREALGQLRLPELKRKRVLIKPNAARLALPGQGITTHPSVLEALIDQLREWGSSEITIGESCIFGVSADEAFQATGMKAISERKRVQLIDLDRFKPMVITIKKGIVKKIRVSSALKEFDFVFSVPLMNTLMHTGVTLSLKNMKGLLWRKEKARLHHLLCAERLKNGDKELDLAISEMASVLFPHLAIIDGTVGMEGMGPAYGKSKKVGVIVAGRNALSVDAIATRLMGFDPSRIPHLRLCAERGLGEIRLGQISVRPADYLKWESPFEPPPSELAIPFPGVKVHDQGSCSGCLSTLLIFLRNYLPKLSGFCLEDGKIHVGIGRHLNLFPKGTILIGNCTSSMRKEGVFAQGCPPVASEIWKVLSQQ